MENARLDLTRAQILGHRRLVGALDQRLTRGKRSLRKSAWAGLQDSMPRAALVSIHARMQETEPTTLDDTSLVQIWGPRFSAYVVAQKDLGIFTLGRMPDDADRRHVAEDLAARLRALLGDGSMSYGNAGRALGEHPNRLRRAAPTGTVLISWDGARQPTIRSVPPPDVDRREARLELARRYLHVFGPATAEGFARWAGIKSRSASQTFGELRRSLIPVTTPFGEAAILAEDELSYRGAARRPAPARLLPSGDAYYLFWADDRELLIPEDDHRNMLWTSRVWPGAVLVHGEIVGIWRRARNKVTIETWEHLGNRARDAVVEEASSLPLPNVEDHISVGWVD